MVFGGHIGFGYLRLHSKWFVCLFVCLLLYVPSQQHSEWFPHTRTPIKRHILSLSTHSWLFSTHVILDMVIRGPHNAKIHA